MLNRFSPTIQGIILIIIAMAAFAAINVMIRILSFELPSAQIVFLRNIMSLVVLAPIVLYKGPRNLHTDYPKRHFWRAFIGLIAMELMFYGISLMPLNPATALSFTTPLFTTILAVTFLGERIGIYRILALCVGFGGTLIILLPGIENFSLYAASVMLAAAFMIAVAVTIVKHLTSTEPPWRIVTYMALYMSIMSAPLAYVVWQPISETAWIYSFAIALLSTIAQLAMVSAFARASMVILAPFDFTKLAFTAILTYVALGEIITIWTAAGALVIVASTAFITWREAKKARATKPSIPTT